MRTDPASLLNGCISQQQKADCNRIVREMSGEKRDGAYACRGGCKTTGNGMSGIGPDKSER